MNNWLVIGGIHEALQLVRSLSQRGVAVHYSLAGKGRLPDDLPCPVRIGAFVSVQQIQQYLYDNKLAGIVDCSHPYAQGIKSLLAKWRANSHTPLLAYRRPPWSKSHSQQWQDCEGITDMLEKSRPYKRILCTLGSSALHLVEHIRPHQFWWIRCLLEERIQANFQVLQGRGPFTLEQERKLLLRHSIEALLCKNSGGNAVYTKIQAANELGVPIFMLARPACPQADEEFSDIDSLLAHLKNY